MIQHLSLNGRWTYHRQGGEESGPAEVPGDIYRDLLANAQIPDPFYRDNEERLQWIGQSDWTYQRLFDVPADLLDRERVLLCCDGLDTLATVRINGRVIATTDNMFRRWEWDIKDRLRPGRNEAEICFASAVRHCEALAAANGLGHLLYPNKIYAAIPGMMRKQPCNFGWDWGIKAVTCGIWRDIGIVAFTTARLLDVRIAQDHDTPGRVGLTVDAKIDGQESPGLRVRAVLSFEGATAAVDERPIHVGESVLTLTVTDPRRWWPNNMGDQPLYDIAVELLDAGGAPLDMRRRRIGLRTLQLERRADQWGESFRFAVNGVPFFAKGANWIPADAIQSRMTAARYRALVKDAAAANMNMLRVWGGGIYEDESFYAACDELGVCVWQEFTFGGGTSPLHDPMFRANVAAEACDQVRRLRDHPCIALWCGNNEMEMGQIQESPEGPGKMSWKSYSALFDDLLPGIVRELHPGCDYWPSSPHSPQGDRADFNNPRCGDAHLWAVWHEGRPFEWYRTCHHRFCSEFGFQSLPEPRTVHAFTVEDDRNIASFIMEQHQRSHGNSRIMEYMLSWFRAPSSFESTLWLSQILQGMSIKYACEHWRRSMPRGMGTLYWQLNDCWPVASWSSIDYHGRWKALHYMARHFFAPLMISGVENVADETFEVHLTSDLLKPTDATAAWIVTDIDGRRLREGRLEASIPASTSRLLTTLQLGDLVADHEKRGLLIWLVLEAGGRTVSRNFGFFSRPIRRPRVFSPRPKHLDLSRDPGIRTRIEPRADGSSDVVLTADRPALWTWIELDGRDARLSDNFIHLCPGVPLTVNIATPGTLAPERLNILMRVRSLVDTYR